MPGTELDAGKRMKSSYTKIQRQIAKLQHEAALARALEVPGVIGRIREAIAVYELSVTDLFDRAQLHTDTPLDADQPYSDGNGNVWGGRGPRPKWLREALAAGHSLNEFVTDRARHPLPVRKLPVRFRDAAGNMWSGRGSTPRWLVAELAAGKNIDDFRVE